MDTQAEARACAFMQWRRNRSNAGVAVLECTWYVRDCRKWRPQRRVTEADLEFLVQLKRRMR